MYTILLVLHSVLRWFVLGALLARIGRGLQGWLTAQSWTKLDKALNGATIGLLHTQVVLGLVLYGVSPLIQTSLANMGATMKDASLRFFAVEHVVMMLIAAVVGTLATALSRRVDGDARKHKYAALLFLVALLIILAAIPWPFRAAVARPWLTLGG